MKNNPPNSNLIPVSDRLRIYTEDPRLMIQRQIKKSFLIIIFTVVIAGGLIFYLSLRLNHLAADLGDKQNQLTVAINNSSNQNFNSNLSQSYAIIAPFAEKIKAALPSSDNLLDYQTALEQAAQTASVQISVNFAAAQAGQSQAAAGGAAIFKTIEHTVELKGNLTNFAIFVKALENLPYFVQITNFNLASQTGLDQDSTATLTLKVYTQ